MDDENRITEERILSEYFKVLKEGFIPQTRTLKEKVKDRLEAECMDLAYGKNIVDNVTEEKVHNTLSTYKHIHRYEGKSFYECQNPMFFDWFSYQSVLLLTQNQ
jgi:hypothetical protein